MKKLVLGFILILFSEISFAQTTCEEWIEYNVLNFQNACHAGCSGGVYGVYSYTTNSNGNPMALCTFKSCLTGDYVGEQGYNISFCGTSPISQKQIPDVKKPKIVCGSIVHAETRIVGERIPIVGASFELSYFSNWVQGRAGDYTLTVPIADDPPRDNIVSFDVVVKSGGVTVQTTNYTNNQPNVAHTYVWNGLDGSSNPTLGGKHFVVTVTENRPSISIPISSEVHLGSFKSKLIGLGGWLPSIYAFYDSVSNKLYKGDGTVRSVVAVALSGGGKRVAEEDASLVYDFDSTGKVVAIKTGLLGTTIYSFSYDGQGRLSSISEPFSRTTTFNRNFSGDLVSIDTPKGHTTTVSLDSNGYLESAENPNSETYEMTYSGTGGLLSTFTKPQGQVSTFTYDSAGGLITDAHSGGYFFDLVARTGNGYTADVKRETPMGRETIVQTNGDMTTQSSTITLPNTSQETFTASRSGIYSSDSSSARGISVSNSYQDDARFGAMSIFPTQKTYGYGSAYYYFTNSQSITLTDPDDPFSIDTYSINSTKNSFNVTTDYDPTTKTFSKYTALGKTSETVIDSYERIVSQKRGNLHPVEFTYTNENLTKIEQDARETTLAYNSTTGFLSSITNPLSQTTAFTYDSAGRVATKIFPDLRTITYSYDANGNVSGITPPGRTIHSFGLNANELPNTYEPPTLSGVSVVNTTYSYNDDKQLVEINKPNGDSIEYTYNATTGALESIVAPAGTYTVWMNNGNGLPGTIAAPTGISTNMYYAGTIPTQYSVSDSSYTFNNGYVRALASNGTVNDDTVSTSTQYDQIYYTYDNDEYLTGAGDLTLAYSTPSALLNGTSIGSSPNIVTDEYTYNSFGEVTNYKAKYGTTVIYDLDLARDGMGRINGKTQTMNSTTDDYDYTFDSAGRLTQTNKNSSTVATYDYDDNSNRDGGTIGGITTTATYDAQDRMTAYNQLTFTYNANGDLTSKTHTLTSTTTSYTYDVFGNLTSVTMPNADVFTYEIDGLNRRVGKLKNGVVQKRWIYMDQTRIAAEVDSSGNITKRFVYGSKSNIPDYMIMGSDDYRIISDQLGSPRLVVKVSDGTIAGRMDHDEYGRVTANTNPGLLPFGFAGGLYDTDTALVRFGVRDYAPEIGRWTAKDPILFGGGDTNLFGYVLQNPVNFIDPSGKYAVGIVIPIGDIAIGIGAAYLCANVPKIVGAVNEIIDAVVGGPPKPNCPEGYDAAKALCEAQKRNSDEKFKCYADAYKRCVEGQ
ncbi:RHS repeat domain-containing protein [Bdellovibrio sp. HCB337]|uniref:RHS repeat domain-containing protein n=1 Tax=Bdellovibrio sp. HCB337 TaxID=3394358 RepID=UPI0039A42E00